MKERFFYMKSMISLGFTYALLLTTPVLAQMRNFDQQGQTPAELMFIYDPLKIDRKEPSFWYRPSEDTAKEQLVYAQAIETEDDYEDAIDAYQDLVHRWHNTPQALTAQLRIANLFELLEKPQESYDEFIYLLAHYKGKFDLEPVLKKSLAQADLLSHTNKTFFGLDLNSNDALRKNYERISHFAPRWDYTPEILMRIGGLYDKEKAYESSITIYDRLVIQWPTARCYDQAVYAYAQAVFNLASVSKQDIGRLAQMERLINGVLKHDAQHPSIEQFTTWKNDIYTWRRDQSYVLASYYDKRGYKNQAAYIAYQAFLRDFPDAPQAPEIRTRLATLMVNDIVVDEEVVVEVTEVVVEEPTAEVIVVEEDAQP